MASQQRIGNRYQLGDELGEDIYHAAWEQGKALDLETVVKELLAEFGEDDGHSPPIDAL